MPEIESEAVIGAHQPTAERVARYLGKSREALTAREQLLVRHMEDKPVIAADISRSYDARMTFGERLADNVARFGGSWGFIILFALVLLAWILLNLIWISHAFDPYPFIFLNLVLSMLAAVQAPVIMMSQNRQAAKDRLDAAHDYEVNLKAEIEIMALHDKLDQLRNNELKALIEKQQEQIDLLTRIIAEKNQAQ